MAGIPGLHAAADISKKCLKNEEGTRKLFSTMSVK
jgi:hypothetical protein